MLLKLKLFLNSLYSDHNLLVQWFPNFFCRALGDGQKRSQWNTGLYAASALLSVRITNWTSLWNLFEGVSLHCPNTLILLVVFNPGFILITCKAFKNPSNPRSTHQNLYWRDQNISILMGSQGWESLFWVVINHIYSDSLDHSIFFQLKSHFLASGQSSLDWIQPNTSILKAIVCISAIATLLKIDWCKQNFVVFIFFWALSNFSQSLNLPSSFFWSHKKG